MSDDKEKSRLSEISQNKSRKMSLMSNSTIDNSQNLNKKSVFDINSSPIQKVDKRRTISQFDFKRDGLFDQLEGERNFNRKRSGKKKVKTVLPSYR